MKKKPIDLTEVLESTKAERIADRLGGELSETEEKVWGGDFAASGGGKNPPPPGPMPPAP
jgi:hypothetical protein